jgi:lipid-binding SYLF domain-containing protein
MSITMKSVAVAMAAVGATLCIPSVATAADVKTRQAEVQKMCSEALAVLYKAKPETKAEIAKAPGYACFTSFGMSFFIGGAGGSGMVHNNATKANTYMKMAQASGGLDFGIKDYREVLVFKSAKALATFVDKGWEFGGGGGAAAKASGSGAASEDSMITSSDIVVYPMTKTGLQVGVAAAGRKYWKDDELNAAK